MFYRIVGTVAACITCGTSLAWAQTSPTPAPATVRAVTETRYGETLTDPYRWMEKVDPELVAWLRAQDAHTRGELKALPGYGKLLSDTTEAVESDVRVNYATRVGDLIYYKKQGRGEAQASLYVRPLAGGPERRLVDPVALRGATTAINDYAVSPDNRRLAYSLAEGGSEEATLYVMDLANERTFPEAIDRARFASPSWSPDGAYLVYTRLKAGGVGADRFNDEAVYRHVPGEDPARDVAIFKAADVGSALGREAFVGVYCAPGSAYLLALANSGVSPESEWYIAPASELATGPHWRRVAALTDKIDQTPIVHGDSAWLVTFKDTPRRKVVRVDLQHPDLTMAEVVAPERLGVLKNVSNGSDGIYLIYAEAGAYHLDRLGYDGALTSYTSPFVGSMYELAADPWADGAVVSLQSFIAPPDFFLAKASALSPIRLAPPYPLDLSALTVDTIEATAKDGVKIPVTVVHRRDLKRDGSATALVDAYGAYGSSSDSYFDPLIIPFLLRGDVYAEAHVRGGGEFGETWHLAGKGANKPNTWRDFIASVERLEALGYTSPVKVAGMGVSAGGVMIGRTVTERPDLLAAAVMWAPMINTLRFETTEGGPANVTEFGTTATAQGYADLRVMDSYSHVVDGAKYPAVLLTGGINDHRVPVWMAAEMAARLQAASTSGKPVRLRIDFQGGHHMMGAAKADQISQMVDTEAFVLHATGAPDF